MRRGALITFILGLLVFAAFQGAYFSELSRHERTWGANEGIGYGFVMFFGSFVGMCLFAVGAMLLLIDTLGRLGRWIDRRRTRK